ncbi:MAG: hypothetical protein DKT66_01545 [Candidatus Melainabacteria bacterium]|nr:MAG: hypothetical protein DKT66_01545 [Candidatus Melainabacteria bacterium]
MLNANSWKRFRQTAIKVSAVLLLSAFPLMPSAQAANGTILVCTQAGGDVAAAKQALTDAGCTVLAEIPCQTGGFSILHVRPNNGDVAGAVAKFNGKVDANILSAEASFQSKLSGWFNWPPRPSCVPNDPDYPDQYALPAMQWNDARCTLRLLGMGQRAYPRITVIDSGHNLVTAGEEMTQVRQFNFAGGANGVAEAPFDSGVHGTAVSSIMSCKTNNSTFIAGTASHNLPVKVVACRVTNDGETIDTMDVLRAMTWCVDNQALRGGPGAINLSINSSILPTYNGSSVVQEIAKAARKQGDLFVNGSGNSGIVDPSPEQYLRRVMAYDENNQVAAFSNTGPFKAGAPGVNITVVAGNPAQIYHGDGTSFSGPFWAGGIAFLQSFVPWSNPVRLDSIIYRTCDDTPQGNKIPNFNRALVNALLFGWW